MKINDVVIKEMGSRGYVPPKAQPAAAAPAADPFSDGGGYDAMGNPTNSNPSASPTNVAAPKPAQAGQAKWPATDAEIRAFQKANGLKVDGMIGGKTMAALNKAGAKAPPGFKPVGPKAAAKPAKPAAATAPVDQAAVPASANASSGYAGATPPAAAAADTAADQATAAQTQTSNYTGDDQRTANARDANAAPPVAGYANQETPAAAAPDPEIARLQQLGGMQAQVANPLQPAPQADKPNAPAPDQAAQPTPAPGEFTPVPSGYNTTAPAVTDRSGNQVKTGTGGTLTSRSDDELAWASKQPMGGTGQQYPGPGNWDPRTGRDLKAAAQGEKNLQSIKNFLGFGKKTEPAAPAAAPVAAAATSNPWAGKDPAKEAAWSKLSPQDQKWLGGADPTDKFILMRAPKKGAPAPAPAPAAAPAPGQGSQPAKGPATPGGYGQFSEETSRLRRLAGLE
jgi:hypothetical protein